MGYEDQIESARTQLQAGKYSGAAGSFKQAARSAPDPDHEAQAYLNAGRCHLADLDYTNAASCLNYALSRSVLVVGKANYYLGLVYIRQRNYDQAQEALLAAAKGGYTQATDKLNELYLARGLAALYGRSLEFASAIKYFTLAGNSGAGQPHIDYYLGLAYEVSPNPNREQALGYFTRAYERIRQLKDGQVDPQLEAQVRLELKLLTPLPDQFDM